KSDSPNEELSKEALFESLGHPLRIKILESVKEAPLAFSEIKRNVGREQWSPDLPPRQIEGSC
ncbi:MAG TPA: hypothetical protein PKX17_07305, partial [Candidatus Methanomethylicus sp.]|nr:hypothetical protein [Candidatus Methanomethylicus sp.]